MCQGGAGGVELWGEMEQGGGTGRGAGMARIRAAQNAEETRDLWGQRGGCVAEKG